MSRSLPLSLCLLLGAMVGMPTAQAHIYKEMWFEKTDISLPRHMDTGVLDNGIRYVFLPVRADQPDLSLRATIKGQNPSLVYHVDHSAQGLEAEFAAVVTKINQAKKVNPELQGDDISLVLVGNVATRDVRSEVLSQLENIRFIEPMDSVAFPNPLSDLNAAMVMKVNGLSDQNHITVQTLIDCDAVDSKDARKERLSYQLVASVIEKRLNDALLENQLPYLQVSVRAEETVGEQWLSQVTVTTETPQMLDQVKPTLLKALDDLARFGVKEPEMLVNVESLRQQLVQPKAMTSADYADDILHALQQQRVYQMPNDEIALFDYHVAHMTDDELSNAAAVVWANDRKVTLHKVLPEESMVTNAKQESTKDQSEPREVELELKRQPQQG